MPSLAHGHRTDVGRARKSNQDSLAVLDAAALDQAADGLFVVADGMGGSRGGEVASRVAAETVPAVVVEALRAREGAPDGGDLLAALHAGIAAANDAVWRQSSAKPELRGMGTTCVAALVRGPMAAIGNVGDSRAYVLRSGDLLQLTHDHSLVQEYVRQGGMTADEARGSRFRNVITRAVGIASDVEPDVSLVDLHDGDVLLLCSDGLTNMVDESRIAATLATCPHAQEACDRLVEAANAAGGADNITAIVLQYGAFRPSPMRDGYDGSPRASSPVSREDAAEAPRSRLAIVLPWVLCAVLAALLGAVASGRYALDTTYPFVHTHIGRQSAPPPPRVDYSQVVYESAPTIVLNKAVRPAPVSCDAAGVTYVVAAQTGRVLRVAPDGRVASGFPWTVPSGAAAGPFWAAGPAGYLYVSSPADRCIYRYAPTGTRVAVIGQGQLKAPAGLAVDGTGTVYVVDAGRLKAIRPSVVADSGAAGAEAHDGAR